MTAPGPEQELLAIARGRLGRVLKGKYRLDRVLGVGGMAAVYSATHRNQAEFAIKMLHPELSLREQLRSRFLREGYVANTVKHPGAVSVVDDDVAEDGAAFVVMELLRGATVERLCESHGARLPVAAVLGVADQLLDVLVAAHARGVVHRDIKPGNLFVTEEGTLKVLDFGVARLRDAAGASTTSTGVMLGTPAFMPPEQALAKASEIDAQSDVWAVGATLFTMLSGQLVHRGDNAPQLLVQAATTQARSVSSASGAVPAELVRVVDRALAFHKIDRWASASAMRDAVREAYAAQFGGLPDRSVLADLVQAVPPSGLPEVARVATLTSGSAPPGPPPPQAPVNWSITGSMARDDMSSVAPAPSASPPPHVDGRLVTGQPVSSERAATPAPSRLRGRGRGLVLLGAAAVAGLVGVTLAFVAPGPRSAGGPGQAQAPTAVVTPPPPVAPVVSLAAPAEALPPPSAAPVLAAPSASLASRVTPPRAPAARPDCTPSYTLDADGNKHFKPECFTR